MMILLAFNWIMLPWLMEKQIREVDYGTFMTMTEQEQIGEVEVQDNRILFTDKEGKTIYKTGLMNDPSLTERLYESGAKFTSEIIEEASPILSFLLT